MKKISVFFTICVLALAAVFFNTSVNQPEEDGAQVKAATTVITIPQEYYTFTITHNGTNYSAVCTELPALTLTNSGVSELIADIDAAAGVGKVKKLNFQGAGGNALNIGAETAYLNSGTYIVTGKITGSYGIIELYSGDNLYVDEAEITATDNGCALYNNSTGNINILSGTISSTGSYTIWNNLAGAINISSGTVSATAGVAICNNRNGAVNISGGTVSAVTGVAIRNYRTGRVTVSKAAGKKTLITSANTTLDRGTIFLDNITTTTTVLEITGGVVENTANSSYANAIYNLGTGNIEIKGGEVNSGSIAIHNSNTGNVDISGGTVKAVNMYGTAIYSNSGKITVSGTAIVTSVNTSSNPSEMGTVRLSPGTLLEITGGVVENMADNNNACAIINLGAGIIEIKGGKVKATGGRAIFNENNGNVFISGGEVSATTGVAVYNFRSGEINISGGEVKATTGNAVYINCYNGNTIGKLIISEAAGRTTIITSKNMTDKQEIVNRPGTVYLAYNSSYNNQAIFEITGGTIENTADNPNACALFNFGSLSEVKGGKILSTGGKAIHNERHVIDISGGIVSAIDGNSVGFAIWNGYAGIINILGGEVKGTGYSIWNDDISAANIYGGTVSGGIYNKTTGAVNIYGGEVKSAGNAIYNAGAGDIKIAGGSVKATGGGTAIRNDSTGAVAVSSGTVSSDYGAAIRNYSIGKIIISGTTLVTSGCTYNPGGTVWFDNAGGELIFTGGNITNSAGGNIFYNPNNAAVTVPVIVSVNGPEFWNQNVSYVPEGHVIGLSNPLTDPVSTFTFNAFEYQWYKIVPGGEDILISGAEGKNLTVKNISDSGTYYAIVFTYILGIKSTEGVKSEETTINIGKASSAGSILLDGWKAGKNANNPVLSGVPSECGTPVYEYKLKEDPDSAYAATKPTAAGEYTVRATFTGTDNYDGFNLTANFTIAAAGNGLSTGGIAGIAAGSVVIIGLIVLVVIMKKKKA